MFTFLLISIFQTHGNEPESPCSCHTNMFYQRNCTFQNFLIFPVFHSAIRFKNKSFPYHSYCPQRIFIRYTGSLVNCCLRPCICILCKHILRCRKLTFKCFQILYRLFIILDICIREPELTRLITCLPKNPCIL